MLRLEASESLGRVIRKDPWPELTIFSTDRIKGSLTSGRPDEALALADYLPFETQLLREGFAVNAATLCVLVARNFGEEAFFDLLYELAEMSGLYGEIIPPLRSVQEFVWFWAEYKRSQRMDVTVTEEADRFVFRYGSRPHEAGVLAAGSAALEEASRAFDWTWNRPNVPYYIARLCIWGEIYPARRFGWPLLITDWAPGEAVPTIQYVYKDPSLIPSEYFERIGVARDPSKFLPLAEWGSNRFRRKGLATLPLADTDRPLQPLDRPAIIRASPSLGRGIRQDPVDELGTYTNDLIKQAVQERDYPAARILSDYWEYEMRTMRLGYTIFQASFTTLIAKRSGEKDFERIHREWSAFNQPGSDRRYSKTMPKTDSIDELAQFRVETKRGQGYRFQVRDEGNRYALHFAPCGTGGVLRTLRTGDGQSAPYMGRTASAHEWAFGRDRIPYYCVHCWMGGVVRATESNGYPHYVFDFADIGDFSGACTQYIYKTPDAVPGDVFRRMGKTKAPYQIKSLFDSSG